MRFINDNTGCFSNGGKFPKDGRVIEFGSILVYYGTVPERQCLLPVLVAPDPPRSALRSDHAAGSVEVLVVGAGAAGKGAAAEGAGQTKSTRTAKPPTERNQEAAGASAAPPETPLQAAMSVLATPIAQNIDPAAAQAELEAQRPQPNRQQHQQVHQVGDGNGQPPPPAPLGRNVYQDPDVCCVVFVTEPTDKQSLHRRSMEVNAVMPAVPRYMLWSDQEITWSFKDHPKIMPNPGGYALVVDPIMHGPTARVRFSKVLIDNGSSINIMYRHTMRMLGITENMLQPTHTTFHGIIPGLSCSPMGKVRVDVSFGGRDNCRVENVLFEVVDLDSPYHALLERPAFASFMASTHTAYLKMKKPAPSGPLTVVGNYKISLEIASAGSNLAESLVIAEEKRRMQTAVALAQSSQLSLAAMSGNLGTPAFKPTKETKDIVLDPAYPERTVRIGAGLSVPRELAEHSLNVRKDAKPVRQPLRRFAEDRRKIIGEEVTKLLVSGFIVEVLHTEWLANPVLVEKKKEENMEAKVWRMCIDYTNLNKACPKDPFPLPRIDQVIDSTAGCELLSFLDAYSGFHQIPLNGRANKTALSPPHGAYCYVTMPFGLRNAGATYQRCMQKCLFDQSERMCKSMWTTL
ncbi:hypothetical protein QYE76_016186 [Lolium multiflorum]|uniref:Reverse transcriptase domain-containing protein n=1 Tax=Lolium multiflorum TaxID=4521 RepID=A0AAD8U7X6_LOLMU|nr:hypothetical protein QYE76_016186 [Lolium multiflorum]